MLQHTGRHSRMHQRWLKVPTAPPAHSRLSTEVKFSLTSNGSDSSWSDETLQSPKMQRRSLKAANDSEGDMEEPRRPVTMTTCCAAELRQAAAESSAGNRNQTEQSAVPPAQAATTAVTAPATPAAVNPCTTVYCENSLAKHRPPPRRTFSYPPPTGGDLPRLLLVVAQPVALPASAGGDIADADVAKLECLVSLSTPVVTEAGGKCRERRVRFADALGFELTSVRVICNPDDPPEIPCHVLAALNSQRLLGKRLSDDDFAWNSPSDPSLPAETAYSTCWRPLFPCRTADATVCQRLPEQGILLESIRLETMALEATVLVRNLGPVKQVDMRLTDSGWHWHSDLPLQYLNSLPDQSADRFQLRTCLPVTAFASQRIEFALRLWVEGLGGEFWDNNDGRNYAFVRLPQPHRASCVSY